MDVTDRRGENAAGDPLIGGILSDVHDDDTALVGLCKAFEERVSLPADAFVIGEPISVDRIYYDGNTRIGPIAECRREDGTTHVVPVWEVVFPRGSIGAGLVNAYRAWLGLEPHPDESEAAARGKRPHKAADVDLDSDGSISLVVTSVTARAIRCRLQASERIVTFRSSGFYDAVPGEIVTVAPKKRWRYAGHPYLSGDVVSARLDAKALGLVPLKLNEEGLWDPKEEYWGEEGEPIEEWAKPIIARGPRPQFEMEQVIPGENPEDPDMDPIMESNDLKEAGDFEGARKILMDLCRSDLRCLDAHAHLGNLVFDHPQTAVRHFEVGLRIGELSLGEGFDGVLPWGLIDNRPFMRSMHGYGLCLWRLGRFEEAGRVFDRMLWLNPTDDQGARFLIADVRAGTPWHED